MPGRHPWAFERGTLWALELDSEGSQQARSVAAPAAATFGEVPHEAAAVLAEAMGERPPRLVRERFESGRRCFAAWVNGEIAAYGWVSHGEECIGELERSLRMRPSEAYIWDCATLPPFRRRGLYTALLRSIVGMLREEGIHRIWIGAGRGNSASIRGFAAAGFQPVLNLTYARILALRYDWVSDAAVPSDLSSDARQSLLTPRAGAAGSVRQPAAAPQNSHSTARVRSVRPPCHRSHLP